MRGQEQLPRAPQHLRTRRKRQCDYHSCVNYRRAMFQCGCGRRVCEEHAHAASKRWSCRCEDCQQTRAARRRR
jgi:hypothetical protein